MVSKRNKKSRGRRAKKRKTASGPKKRSTTHRAKKRAPARKRTKKAPSGAPRRRVGARALPPALPLARTLSGASWVAEFPGSRSTADLTPAFGTAADAFIAAMRTAGATVQISSTFRPPERAYLMHFCWLIAREEIDERTVPPKEGVDIEWAHSTHAESVAAARAMVQGYQLVHIAALSSRHTEKRAVDMSIAWSGDLSIRSSTGATKVISSVPRTGANTELHAVGLTYGVVKLLSDPPHWSDDGH